MSTLTPEEQREAYALYCDLQMLTAGHPVNICMQAGADSIASTIGFAAEDLAHADHLADLFAVDLKEAIRKNWDYLREVRAAAVGIGHG